MVPHQLVPGRQTRKAYRDAYRRKKDKSKAIKIVARKLVNIVWAVWTRGKEFTMIPDKA